MSDAAESVSQVVHAFATRWNQHDMDAFAELFAPDAEFVNVVGLWWRGRDAIREAHAYTHATLFKHSRLTIADVSVRFPVDSVAVARSTWRLEGHVSPEGEPLAPRNGILLTLLSATPDGWLIIDAQNTDIIEACTRARRRRYPGSIERAHAPCTRVNPATRRRAGSAWP